MLLLPQTQQQQCTRAQAIAGQLAEGFSDVSTATGWAAFGTGVGAVVSTAGEGVTFGLDTPVTISFDTLTAFYGTASFVTGAAGSGLRSFANGNMTALRNFDVSSMVNLAAQAASSRFSAIRRWGERIGDLAQQATDVALEANSGCP